MTHNCVSSTARSALDSGYRVTIVANATATRDLPDGKGGIIGAATLQAATLGENAAYCAEEIITPTGGFDLSFDSTDD